MNQHCFVLEFAHSLPGRVKRIHVTYKSLAYLAGFCLVIALVGFGLLSTYVQMSWKMSHYNEMRADLERLRTRYQELEKVARQHTDQMASLESLATEMTVAYGITGANQAGLGGPTLRQSMEEFNALKTTEYTGIYHHYAYQWQAHPQPNLWPIAGIVRSSFGARSDPFSGEGAFHTGLDLAAPKGTPVHATADGVVASAGWAGAYGRLVVIDHGNGMETCYAHLSQSLVVPGQTVTRGEVIALSGSSGRSTGPHLHYEVRLGGAPVNPYKYLGRPKTARAQLASSRPVQSDLGL
ncbi:MAG: M23 family metallopeptidase [Acidobacteriaceae bacterium]|nr:M23 family metallopeptidase [Acidobacteriaceae bacterium]